MPIDDLLDDLVAAARAAFTEVREQHPDESFYCFALYTSELASYIEPTCNSEEGLRRAAQSYVDEYGDDLSQRLDDLRWNPPDWPYHLFADEHFSALMEELDDRGHPFELDDAAMEAEVAARFEVFFGALAVLDEEGFFGRGAERERVIVTVLEGDQSDSTRLADARRLNPPAAVARLERDLAIPDSVQAPAEVTYLTNRNTTG